MGKEILTFGDTEILLKNKFCRHKSHKNFFFKDVDIEKLLASDNTFLVKKSALVSTLVSCIIIIKLRHYI